MNNVELSILVPSIRVENLPEVYQSITTATSRTFEMIVISPFPLPAQLANAANVKYIKDYGSLIRCSQLGLLISEGTYIMPNFCDDGLFLPGAIDKGLDLLLFMGEGNKNIVTCKYSESKDFSAPERFQNDDYYKIVNSYPVNKTITPADWWIMNFSFLKTEYLKDLGGFDCQFSTCIGHCDVAIRAYLDGAQVQMSPTPIAKLNHSQPFHEPIEITQVFVDTPLFKNKYDENLTKFPVRIDINNWQNAERIWSKRFSVK